LGDEIQREETLSPNDSPNVSSVTEKRKIVLLLRDRLLANPKPTTMEVHTREGHPFQWLHGPFKDPYKVTEYGEKLGIGSREYELVDVLPLE
jgi:hypothetical protein